MHGLCGDLSCSTEYQIVPQQSWEQTFKSRAGGSHHALALSAVLVRFQHNRYHHLAAVKALLDIIMVERRRKLRGWSDINPG